MLVRKFWIYENALNILHYISKSITYFGIKCVVKCRYSPELHFPLCVIQKYWIFLTSEDNIYELIFQIINKISWLWEVVFCADFLTKKNTYIYIYNCRGISNNILWNYVFRYIITLHIPTYNYTFSIICCALSLLYIIVIKYTVGEITWWFLLFTFQLS